VAQHTPSPDENPPQTGGWIKPFGEVFIGLNDAAVIRRVIGAVDIPPDLDALQIQGLTWLEFVKHFAAEDTQTGLHHLWMAVAEQHVAPAYWPTVVPFKPGVVARLRAVIGDPIINYVCHLSPAEEHDLGVLIGPQTLDVTQQLIQLSQNVFKGVHGPLTDSQVKAMRGIVTIAETVNHLLHDVRTEVIAPATTAPLPYPLRELFTFSTRDFPTLRRITTHELRLISTLPEHIKVYSYRTIRDITRRMLETLLGGINARTAITITATVHENDTVQVIFTYQSSEPALRAEQRITPITLFAAERFQAATTLLRLITTMQSHIAPIHSQVWAAPVADTSDTMQVCISLPYWRDDTPAAADTSAAPSP
jgi:peptidoglycan hydrolase-like protein with peptidoglycan-binding domain